MKILTSFNFANATPMRRYDWVAWVDGREEDPSLYGYGETKGQALVELGEAILEHVDDRIHDLKTSGAISEEIAEICFVDIDGLAYAPGMWDGLFAVWK